MAETVGNLLFLGVLFLGVVMFVVAPLGALGIMFWHWHKELNHVIRLRQVRSTQVR